MKSFLSHFGSFVLFVLSGFDRLRLAGESRKEIAKCLHYYHSFQHPCLAHGEFLINGFRNRDLRKLLCPATTDRRLQRQQAAAMTRTLALLRAHGWIV